MKQYEIEYTLKVRVITENTVEADKEVFQDATGLFSKLVNTARKLDAAVKTEVKVSLVTAAEDGSEELHPMKAPAPPMMPLKIETGPL